MRKRAIGAEIIDGRVHFRVWAPKRQQVAVVIEGRSSSLEREKNGYFSGFVEAALSHSLYQYRLDENQLLPDPASRFQPSGPHGPSQIIDPSSFKWTDQQWPGITDKKNVILYELHIGTFTHAGTWKSAIHFLSHLVDLGINTIEMMPVTEVPGKFNWGYDGVGLFAPTHNYGQPDDLRQFINQAHAFGIGVILDVVYNHFGPDGNYLQQFADDYFKKEDTEWGQAINFDGENSLSVREFFLENAVYWLDEFHFDGLRFDACHSIIDHSQPHIISEISSKVRELTKISGRSFFLVAENESQQAHYVLPNDMGGYGLDAVFNEDFHHSAFVRLTGHNEAYFSDYLGSAQEFVSSVKYNFLFQGQWYLWQKKNRGSNSRYIPAYHFVNFLENHDQVANPGSAQRLHQLSNIKQYRAMTTLLFLSPQIPLLFQGQEFGSLSPFYYFCDHYPELAKKVCQGRMEFISQFKSIDDPNIKKRIPSPNEESTFHKSKLNWQEKKQKKELFQLHKDLIAMRKQDPVFSHLAECFVDGAVLREDFFIIRYVSEFGERLLIMNLGMDFLIYPASEPLLAPPQNQSWEMRWSSEMLEYGGFGYQKLAHEGNWKISGNSASILFIADTTLHKKI